MSSSNATDMLYQQAVDEMAQKMLTDSRDKILALPDDDTFIVEIAGQEAKGWMRHIQLTNSLHHIVFSLTRRTLLVMHKLYLSGVKFDTDGGVSLLTDREIADYD